MSKLKASRLICVVTAITLSGCAMFGKKEVDESFLNQNLVVGQSTEADVRKLLGEPDNQTNGEGGSGNDYWHYAINQSGGSSSMGRLAGMIPGAGSIVGTAATAQDTATSANAAANSGQTRVTGLSMWFTHSVLSNYNVQRSKYQ